MAEQVTTAAGDQPVKYPTFVENGVITESGNELIAYIESKLGDFLTPSAETNINDLNGMSGPFVEYFSIVASMGRGTTQAKHNWLKGFNQSARGAYDIKRYEEAQALKEAENKETATKTNTLETEFAKLKESVAVQVADLEAQNKALADEITALKSAAAEKPASTGKGAKAAKTEPAADTEAPAENKPADGE